MNKIKISYSISITLLLLGVTSFLSNILIGSYIDKDGLLHEPFALIPIGYLLIFTGSLLGLVTFLISAIITKIKEI